jgi:type IV secretory pathway ATPase VirB11/archaellum biosynthesis ATPase
MGEDEQASTSARADPRNNGSDNEALKRVEKALLAEIDDAVNDVQRARLADAPREHLEVLRALLKAQVSAYMDHFTAKATLFSHTSTMYAREVGTPGVISTTLRGLIEGHTMTTAQAKHLARYVAGRRTLIVFGDRATGKSTLLNALFALVSVDERFVSVERDTHLPALKERSFCVRLSMDDDTDVAGLFAKTEKMQPSRVVVGELHGEEILHFFDLLYRNAKIGGMATLRADSVREAVELLLGRLEPELEREAARRLLAQTRPVFAHMRSDEHGHPRLAAVWSVTGVDAEGELLLREETAAASAQLVAEA